MLLLLLLLPFAVGCNSDACPVSGRITFDDGQPVEGARIVFRAKHEGEFITAFGTSDEDGAYALTTWQTDDGAVPGEHTVIVTKPRQPRELEDGTVELLPPEIHSKYASYRTSPLRYTVEADENVINLRVERWNE